MKKTLLLLLLLAVGTTGFVACENFEDEYNDAQQTIDQLNGVIASNSAALASLQAELSAANLSISDLQAAINTAEAEIDGLNMELASEAALAAQLQAFIEEALAQIEAVTADLNGGANPLTFEGLTITRTAELIILATSGNPTVFAEANSEWTLLEGDAILGGPQAALTAVESDTQAEEAGFAPGITNGEYTIRQVSPVVYGDEFVIYDDQDNWVRVSISAPYTGEYYNPGKEYRGEDGRFVQISGGDITTIQSLIDDLEQRIEDLERNGVVTTITRTVEVIREVEGDDQATIQELNTLLNTANDFNATLLAELEDLAQANGITEARLRAIIAELEASIADLQERLGVAVNATTTTGVTTSTFEWDETRLGAHTVLSDGDALDIILVTTTTTTTYNLDGDAIGTESSDEYSYIEDNVPAVDPVDVIVATAGTPTVETGDWVYVDRTAASTSRSRTVTTTIVTTYSVTVYGVTDSPALVAPSDTTSVTSVVETEDNVQGPDYVSVEDPADVLGAWGDWSPAFGTQIADFTQTRTRTFTQNGNLDASYGGTAPAVSEERTITVTSTGGGTTIETSDEATQGDQNNDNDTLDTLTRNVVADTVYTASDGLGTHTVTGSTGAWTIVTNNAPADATPFDSYSWVLSGTTWTWTQSVGSSDSATDVSVSTSAPTPTTGYELVGSYSAGDSTIEEQLISAAATGDVTINFVASGSLASFHSGSVSVNGGTPQALSANALTIAVTEGDVLTFTYGLQGGTSEDVTITAEDLADSAVTIDINSNAGILTKS